MFSVAITGEIGSGKSTLAKIWGDMGANVFDLDAMAKAQWARREVREKAALRWGWDVFPNGSPDYKKLAECVYRDIDEYRFTIDLIHPGTMAEAARMFHNLRGWVVIEVPLLYETGWFDLIDYAICVTSSDDVRMERIAARGWTESEIAVRERFMMSSHKKQALSDAVMCNIGSLESWKARALEMGALMLQMSPVHELTVLCCDRDEAVRIMSALVEQRLAAGTNIVEVDSVFRWKDEVVRMPEYMVRALTTSATCGPRCAASGGYTRTSSLRYRRARSCAPTIRR